MQKFLPLILLAVAIGFTGGLYFLHEYWIHRYDQMIERQAAIYRLDPRLVWSIIHEETYFRPWTTGDAGEVGLMQITPAVAREWARETGIQELEDQAASHHAALLRDAERNIQIGCWYLEKLFERYRDAPAEGRAARVLAAYNAGASRVAEWEKSSNNAPLSEEEFIRRIDIASTRAYVTNILRRYRYLKYEQGK
jgi:soluble lytic murein transglycosylase